MRLPWQGGLARAAWVRWATPISAPITPDARELEELERIAQKVLSALTADAASQKAG